MVKTCSAKCPICQRLLADTNAEILTERVKRHALLKHGVSISDVVVDDLSRFAKIMGREETFEIPLKHQKVKRWALPNHRCRQLKKRRVISYL